MNNPSINVKHVAYAGLGGHANMFFAMHDSSNEQIKHSVVFFGVEPIQPAYESRCLDEKIQYNYVHKGKKIDLKYYYNIYKYITQKDTDIIFLHNSGLILPAFFARLFHNKKIVVRETHANHLKTKIDWFFLILAFWLTNKTVLLSNAYFNELKETLSAIIKPQKVTIIPNGLDIHKFKENSILKDSKYITIGMQSRLVPIKDHISLVKAVKIIASKYPNQNIRLLIAGEGSTRKEIEELVAQLDMLEIVTFTGMLNEQQLLEMLQSLDIYVHSTLGETMSNAIMQAQSVGLPIIATNVKGVKNVLQHLENGLLFELYDEKELARLIGFLIDNPKEKERLANNSRQYAVENLSAEKMIGSYLNLFNNTLCI